MKNYALEWKDFVNFKQLSFEEFVTKYPDLNNVYFSEKIDGFLGPFIYNQKKSFFQSTTGKEITGIPLVNEYEERLSKLGIKSAVLVGELVAQDFGQIFPFNQTQSIVKTFYAPKNQNLIHHYLYDVLYLNGKRVSYQDALTFIFKNFKPELSHIHIPLTYKGDLEDFRRFFSATIELPGREGCIIRFPDGRAVKVKQTMTYDLVIIGFGNRFMPAWEKDQISYLMTSFIDKDGLFRTSSKVGSGFTLGLRSSLFRELQKVKLYEKDGEFFVPPKIVSEIKAFRTMVNDTNCYSFEKNKYVLVGKKKSITLSHPTFERFRQDKKANKIDVRLEQDPEFKY